MMSLNESNYERVARVMLAVVLFIGAVLMEFSALGIILAILGVIMLVTGTIGFCPIYRMLGISTRGAGSE